VAAGTEAGRAAKAVMEAGGLVSDDIVLAVLRDRLAEPDVAGRHPRRLSPHRAGRGARRHARRAGQRIDAAISLEVDDAEMVTRIAGRFTCAACGEGYHDSFKTPAVPASATSAAAPK
jgi:adenylate kinase